MITWRKSSMSDTGGQCVEVRNDLAALRDSKNASGSALEAPTLDEFVRDVKQGRFDR